MNNLAESVLGLQFAARFLTDWWAVFFIAPLFLAPILTIIGMSYQNRRLGQRQLSGKILRPESAASAETRPQDQTREGRKRRRRSWARRLFVDDRSYHRSRTRQAPQIFAASLVVSCVISALLFFGIATFLVVKAMIIVNEESVSRE